ncbi:MAG: ABC transporter substrate-binding protein [Planctomycetota bacterium]
MDWDDLIRHTKRPLEALLALACLLGLAPACKRERVVPRRGVPERIVPASAAALDYLHSLGLLDRVLAVPKVARQHARELPEAERGILELPAYRSEPILALAPDLVIAGSFQAAETHRALRRRGIRVHVLVPVSEFADVLRNVQELGRLLGLPERAARLGERLRRGAEELRASIREPRPRILPYFNYGTGAWTAGAGTLDDILIELAGGRNAARLWGVRANRTLQIERVLAEPPDYILTGSGGQLEALRSSPGLARLAAVRKDRILVLPTKLRGASSPYLLEAARALRQELRALEARHR